MTDNVNDFIVVEDDEPASGSLQGIAYYQGSLEDTVTAPAGNLFTSYDATEVGFMSGDTLEFWNYFNDGDTIRYIHHLIGDDPVVPTDSNYTTESVFLTQQYDLSFNPITACPSKIESSNNLKTIYDPRAEMNYAQEFIAGYQQQLQDLVDGGDTESLNFEVLMSVPGEALDIRQQLMDESPYLSDTVMKQAIYKEYVLPNAMLRDILVANPQSAKKTDIMDYLDTRIESMPDYMLEEIYQGNDYFGAKEILESKIEYWQQIRSSAKYKLLKSYVLDSTIYHPYDSLINFYQNETDLLSKYKLVFSFLENGDMEQAQSTIDQIPVDFNLSNTELNRHNDYNLLFDIIERIEDSNWSARQLDSVSVSTLQEISSNDYPPVGSYARGLLLKGGHIEYLEQFEFPVTYKSGNSENNTTFSDPIFEDKEYLWLFPNPVKDYVIVYYEVPGEETSNSLIILTDSQGKLLSTFPLENSKNQITLNLKGIANGNYFLSLVQDRRIIETKKMIIGR